MPGALEIEFTGNAIRDCVYLARHSEQLPAILDLVGRTGPRPGLALLSRNVAAIGGIPQTRVQRIPVALARLHAACDQLERSASEIIAEMSETIETQCTDDEKAAWNGAKERIVEGLATLADDHPLLASQKAGRIVHAHQNLLKTAKIITDVRPVFDTDADRIVQTVVTHVLSVDYFDGTDSRTIQFAMDATDVKELLRTCHRAERKARIVKTELGGQAWPTSVFREPEDTSDESSGE